jgi:hypothetical protein
VSQKYQMNGVVEQPANATQPVQPTKKRSMRRPYKSMTHENLISKRSALQAKLVTLQTRLDTWNEKVGKYEFELETRTANTAQAVEPTSDPEPLESIPGILI